MKTITYNYFLKSFLLLFFCQSLPAATENDVVKTADPRLHPGEVRILKLDDSNLKEIIPDTLFMKHWFGTNASIAYFKFPAGKGGGDNAMPALHQHGEEWAIQLKGESQVIEEDGTVHNLVEGDVFIIKPRIWHTGKFGDAENVILGVITPPREDYPAEGLKSFYPGQEKESNTAVVDPQGVE
ncbi:MAG: cupin domain-containing protein [Immundisolibacteraceae bacterium]|nr:cupin domain-containing protein [Immundisolibacteraceae bacterium]